MMPKIKVNLKTATPCSKSYVTYYLFIYLLLLFILYIPEKTQRHLQNTSDFLFDAYRFLEPHRKLLMKSAKHLQIRKCVPKCKQMYISCITTEAANNRSWFRSKLTSRACMASHSCGDWILWASSLVAN